MTYTIYPESDTVDYGKENDMKLTPKEQEICDEYSARDEDGKVHCLECPLNISHRNIECYATIDGRTREARRLERL